MFKINENEKRVTYICDEEKSVSRKNFNREREGKKVYKSEKEKIK